MAIGSSAGRTRPAELPSARAADSLSPSAGLRENLRIREGLAAARRLTCDRRSDRRSGAEGAEILVDLGVELAVAASAALEVIPRRDVVPDDAAQDRRHEVEGRHL